MDPVDEGLSEVKLEIDVAEDYSQEVTELQVESAFHTYGTQTKLERWETNFPNGDNYTCTDILKTEEDQRAFYISYTYSDASKDVSNTEDGKHDDYQIYNVVNKTSETQNVSPVDPSVVKNEPDPLYRQTLSVDLPRVQIKVEPHIGEPDNATHFCSDSGVPITVANCTGLHINLETETGELINDARYVRVDSDKISPQSNVRETGFTECMQYSHYVTETCICSGLSNVSVKSIQKSTHGRDAVRMCLTDESKIHLPELQQYSDHFQVNKDNSYECDTGPGCLAEGSEIHHQPQSQRYSGHSQVRDMEEFSSTNIDQSQKSDIQLHHSKNDPDHLQVNDMNELPETNADENCMEESLETNDFQSQISTHGDTHRDSYICQVCQAAFTSTRSLRVHEHTHRSDKPFRCPVPDCSSTFTSEGHLKIHQNRQHAREAKRFLCTQCGAFFALSSSLQYHMWLHDNGSVHVDRQLKKRKRSEAAKELPEIVELSLQSQCRAADKKSFIPNATKSVNVKRQTKKKKNGDITKEEEHRIDMAFEPQCQIMNNKKLFIPNAIRSVNVDRQMNTKARDDAAMEAEPNVEQHRENSGETEVFRSHSFESAEVDIQIKKRKRSEPAKEVHNVEMVLEPRYQTDDKIQSRLRVNESAKLDRKMKQKAVAEELEHNVEVAFEPLADNKERFKTGQKQIHSLEFRNRKGGKFMKHCDKLDRKLFEKCRKKTKQGSYKNIQTPTNKSGELTESDAKTKESLLHRKEQWEKSEQQTPDNQQSGKSLEELSSGQKQVVLQQTQQDTGKKHGKKKQGDRKKKDKKKLAQQTDQKRYHCSTCLSSFKQSNHLKTHMNVHTREKAFTCPNCKATFTTSSNLSTHVRQHFKPDEFICAECKATFCRLGNLKAHLKKHRGEKEYCCSVCGASFFWHSSLKAHMVRHSGEKPYSCGSCKEAFSYRSSFQNHILKCQPK